MKKTELFESSFIAIEMVHLLQMLSTPEYWKVNHPHIYESFTGSMIQLMKVLFEI